jgi:hypothetical protein
VGILLTAGSALLLVPSTLVLIQVVLARHAQRQQKSGHRFETIAGGERPLVAILIPAHNEESGIEATLGSILRQLRDGDRAVVVADNCKDNTASVARAAGAEVVERSHATLRGKGYALDFGIRHLAADPPDVVIIVDADCRVDAGTIDTLALATVQHQRPTQALYLMHAPPAASARQRLAAFAWLVRNQVRPWGGQVIGWPCQLMGSGMGFLYAQLQHAPVATGNIVEDMQLGMDFAAAGTAPAYIPSAAVHSEFPGGEQAGQQQRTRWEHGHLATITTAWRQWGLQGLRGRTRGLLPMLLDLSVPPLALMVMVQVGTLVVAVAGAATGLVGGPAWGAVALLALGLLLTTWAVLQAWDGFGRHLLSARELLTMPAYALRKIPLYLGYVFKKQTTWVRTERDAKVGKP